METKDRRLCSPGHEHERHGLSIHMTAMKRLVIMSALLLLPPAVGVGQVVQTDNYNEALRDSASYFLSPNFQLPETDLDKRDPSYNFGISLLTTPRDTFACYTYVYMHPTKGFRGSHGVVRLMAEDYDNGRDGRRVPYHAEKNIRRFKDKIRCKVRAYQTYTGNGGLPRSKWYVKCLTADVTYYPLEKSRSSVRYSVEYKKSRNKYKYGMWNKARVRKVEKRYRRRNEAKSQWMEEQHRKDVENRGNAKYQRRKARKYARALKIEM